ncbi:T9SS type A sorting domain-containing protein [Fluviicola sp.]|uniref:T9SS type A sorting domain-containing protein n=1 Tax=Fluviicola sp. TaxID=1917219 RepID=UPI0031E1F324
MKKLLIIACISGSLTGFSQDPEKKGICSASIQLFHANGTDWTASDHFRLDGFNVNNPLSYGAFHIDMDVTVDSLTYEITLPFGDSLQYTAYWHADGMCVNVDTSEVNHLITVLEGDLFPITYEGYYSPLYYDLSQEAYIVSPCLFKIQKGTLKPYFIRVNFQDPPQPETPLTIPEVTNDISIWLSNENTLTVKADQHVIWEINFYSLSGQVIQKSQMEGSQDVDISNLSKGCYIARISSENGLRKQLKFIR